MNFDAVSWLNDLATRPQKNIHESIRIQHLQQLRALLEHFDSPEKEKNILHIAGSKGKGSTAAFLANTLQALGYSVLLFTSPHVFDISERFLLNGKPVSKEKWHSLLKEIHNTGVENLGYFDILTALAFVIWQELDAHYLVLETGIGGRLDATNICRPEAVILTEIELEHTQILGPTLAHIAREKAGIMKPDIPVFCASQVPETLKVLQEQAMEKHAPFFYLPAYGQAHIIGYEQQNHQWYQSGQFCLGEEYCYELPMKMMGYKQAGNALLALLCLRHILDKTSWHTLEQAWTHSLCHSSLPGRFEIIGTKPLKVLDGCHTPQSMEQTVQTWTDLAGTQGLLIFTCRPDKNILGMMPYFKNFSKIVLTGNTEYMRKITQKVQNQFPQAIYLCEEEACIYAQRYAKQMPTLVAGSFYSLAAMKACLQEDQRVDLL